MSLFRVPGDNTRELLRDAGWRLREFVHKPWPEYEAMLKDIHRAVPLSDHAIGLAIGWHRDYHEKKAKQRLEYVRGELRQRHKLVVPMVVKARPTFKKARKP